MYCHLLLSYVGNYTAVNTSCQVLLREGEMLYVIVNFNPPIYVPLRSRLPTTPMWDGRPGQVYLSCGYGAAYTRMYDVCTHTEVGRCLGSTRFGVTRPWGVTSNYCIMRRYYLGERDLRSTTFQAPTTRIYFNPLNFQAIWLKLKRQTLGRSYFNSSTTGSNRWLS